MNDAEGIINEYLVRLNALIDGFNFTRQGHEESIGKDCAGKVAEGILDRSAEDQGGPTGVWLANDPEYTDDKFAKYNVDLIGFRTGQMISLPSLLGRVDVEPHLVTIRYGTGNPPGKSMSSGHISTADKAVTDVQKAGWFTEKKGPFFALDERIADSVRAHVADELALFIRELNAR